MIFCPCFLSYYVTDRCVFGIRLGLLILLNCDVIFIKRKKRENKFSERFRFVTSFVDWFKTEIEIIISREIIFEEF